VAVIEVRVVSPGATVFQGEATSLVAPAWDGRVGVLPGHAPMIALLGAGVLDVDLPGGGSQSFHVAGGVLKVLDDHVTVLTEYAGKEPPTDLPEGVVIHPEDIADIVAERDDSWI
jgi:F-type H+-transporting ATPase subunit epsilon